MANKVLLIPGKSDPGYFSLLLNAFSNAYISVRLPEPGSSSAEIVRWVQSNEPEAACCVVCEHGGSALAVTVAMACARIPTVVVLPEEASLSAIHGILASTPALITASRDPEQIADTVARLTVAVARLSLPGAPAPVITPALAAPARDPKSSLGMPAPVGAAQAIDDVVSDDDHAVLRDLERRMNQPVKTAQPKYEIPIQQQPLDFSIPLREALTSARSFALGEGADVASIDHVVAGIAHLPDHVYGHAVSSAGFSVPDATPADTSQIEPAELPPPSPKVFEAMKLAKVIARARGAQCLCIRDVFEAALLTLNPDTELAGEVDDAIASLPAAEPWQESFFKPSSLDQAGFVEFNSQEFTDIQNRVAPMLDKVEKAKPAKKSPGSPAAKPPRAVVPAAEPPEELQIQEAKAGFPDVDMVEAAADLLLEGHLIALPTDAGYVAMADLTNSSAVTRLRQVGAGQNLQILIYSTAQLRMLVREPVEPHEDFFDSVWPGQVGVVFPDVSLIVRQLGDNVEVPLRIPADDLTLAILSMLSRPTAAVHLHATESIEEQLAGVAAMLIRGETACTVQPTLVKIEGNNRRMIQEGAISRASLESWLTQ